MRLINQLPVFATNRMKKTLLLALACFLSAVAPVLAAPLANASFASERGVPFGLVLDGRPLTRGPVRQLRVEQLAPGLHWADFTLPAGPRGGAVRLRSKVWLEPGLETRFVLVTRAGRVPQLRQAGAVALYEPGPGLPAPGYGSGNGQYDQDGSNGQGQGQYGQEGGYPNTPGTNSGQYGNSTANGQYNNAPTYNNSPAGSYRVLAPQDVDALIQAVKQRPFEATRLSMAKEALSENALYALDLQRLLRSFNFEASRVELATFAYSHVADRQNFYRVYEAFEFDSSVQEVQRATGAGRN
jgi:hypothetical protein